jgi:iron complex transport system ATP-binding protein
MLKITGLSQGFAGKSLFHELTLEILPGQSWGLLGQNGSGKTSLLHCLAGLAKPQSGQIELLGRDIQQMPRKALAQQLGLLTQDEQESFPLRLLDAALAGAFARSGLWGLNSAADRALALDILEKLELAPERLSTGLSGGERRRLGLARLLVQNPRLALLDEPDSHLDICRKGQMLQLVRQHFCTNERACLMSLHDLNLAQGFCSHLLLLFGDGRWLAGAVDEVLTEENLERLFGCPIEGLQRTLTK